MQGMSERDYAARAGLSRGAIQKAKAAGRLVLHADGSIDRGGVRRPARRPRPTRRSSAAAAAAARRSRS